MTNGVRCFLNTPWLDMMSRPRVLSKRCSAYQQLVLADKNRKPSWCVCMNRIGQNRTDYIGIRFAWQMGALECMYVGYNVFYG